MSKKFSSNAAHLIKSSVFEAIFAFAIRISAGLASYIMFALISRVTGPLGFGSFSVAFSVAMTVGLLGSFGQQIFFVKEVPKATTLNEPEFAKGAHIFALTSTLICASIGGMIYYSIEYYVGTTKTANGLAIAGAFLSFFFAFSQTTVGGLRVQERTLYAMASRDLLWRIFAIASIATVAFGLSTSTGELGTGVIMTILVSTLIPIVAVHLYQIIVYMRRQYRGVLARFKPHEWIDTSAGLVIVAVISSSDLYVYTILLGSLVGKEEAGAFFASLKTVELLNMFLMAVTLVVAPEISRIVAKNDRDGFQRVCNKAIILQGIPAVAASVLIIIAAPIFMWIFDPSFVEFSNLLRLLAFGMLLNALTGATVLILQLIGKHWLQVAFQGGSLLLSVILLPFLLNIFGIYGVAIAFIISKLLWNVLAITTIRITNNVDPSLLGLFDRQSGGLAGALSEIGRELTRRKKSFND